MDNRSWPSGGSSWQTGSWDEKQPHDDPGSFKFESEQFFSTAPVSRSNDYCPYSLRQSQLSVPYQYDLLLVYDPEEPYYVERLMEYLQPQNLKIFDFARDAPPGLPQRKVLQSAFQACRYTCIVITKKFTSSFWLQLRTDMSIQDMLDNEQKMYSVIVVVMDPDVKKSDLPLDLATLSPLFLTDRFFEERIKRAFSKTTPFPLSQPSGDFLNAQQPPKYHNVPTAHFDSKSVSNPSPYYMSCAKQSSASRSTTSLGQSHPGSRVPREHGDGTFVMPPSICSSASPSTYYNSLNMHRAVSITVSSTGSRQPQESTESSSSDARSNQLNSITEAKNVFSSGSTIEETDLIKAGGFDTSGSYRASDFSSSSQTDSGSSPHHRTSHRECDSPAFFSLGDPSFIDTTASDMSELEISTAPLSMLTQNLQNNQPPTLRQRSNSLEHIQAEGNGQNPELSDDSCVSLPVNLNHNGAHSVPSLKEHKKSRSMRSLISIKLSQMSKPFKSKKK